ncbi:phosphoglycolate phosphatase [Acidithiobacillus sulfurivorans]|uniref:Phosphoglycolate phosphatase n=1 Tax=Acidithiobacillus sulfurivorans TaxID=1958756 RepID=A0ABS5ZZF2_9PROT|nr:phosphoglycolate phosphatase [Acidithiobacillus sulfurivorans]MBU2760613.1 phosphoglycolate phosphatase [Acidithiobacillus sulfurivorans]
MTVQLSVSAPFTARVVLLDLDGTLIDTAPDLAGAANHALHKLGRQPAEMPVIRGFIGNGVRELMRRALCIQQEPSEAELDAAMVDFSQYYGDHLLDHSQIYPGVGDTLKALQAQGRELVCITNKAKAFTEPLLKRLELYDFFGLVLSGDSLPKKKPDPLQLLHTAAHFHQPVGDCLLVGDSCNDTQAARAASMPVACVTYGYHGDEPVHTLNPDAVLDNMSELLDILA